MLAQKSSCALDLAAQGERTLDEVGRVQALTRERVRQIEGLAVAKIHDTLRDGKTPVGPEGGGRAEEHTLAGGSDMDVQFAIAQAEIVASTSGVGG